MFNILISAFDPAKLRYDLRLLCKGSIVSDMEDKDENGENLRPKLRRAKICDTVARKVILETVKLRTYK